ncbi:hypothetical protein BH23ACT9_BH23ACT9_20050 [soil metagenome]
MQPWELAWRDQANAALLAAIRGCGYQIQMVGYGACACPGCDGSGDDDGPPFAYTVGLQGVGHPELIAFGLPLMVASRLMSSLAGRIVRGEDALEAGEVFTVSWWWQRFIPEVLPNPSEVLLVADATDGRLAGGGVRALQLTHDDLLGRFPWDDGYSLPWLQPRPGTFRA